MIATSRPSFIWFLAEAFALTGLLILAGWIPTQQVAGWEGIAAMCAGCGISFIASIVGAAAAKVSDGNPKRQALVVMGSSMALRLVVVAAGGFAVALSGRFARNPLLIWLALSYAVLLIADTRFVLKAVRPRE